MIDLLKHGEEILSAALAGGGDLGEVFLEERFSTAIRFEDGKVEQVVSGTDAGAGVRVLTGGRTLYAHTNNLTREGLLAAARTVSAGGSGHGRAGRFDYAPERYATPARVSAQDVPTARKVELVKAADGAARASSPRVTQTRAVYGDSVRRIFIVNSDNRYVEETRPQVIFMVHVVATDQALIQTGYEAVGGALGFELFDTEDPEAVARTAARRACLMLDAAPAPTGVMPVVIASEAGGTMIHEAVGHGLEADHIEKGMSKYCGRLGEVIAAETVTVVDDGALPGRRGSGRVDDEGTPAQRTVLIDRGRLTGFLHDLQSARKMGLAPTGNGRRESYEHYPVPRMTNTFIMSGADDPGDILASTERGVFVRKMGGGEVNPLNGDFVFEVDEGYLIEHGRAEQPIRGATLIGNGPDVLMQIDRVGSDLGFAIGTCGKHGQGVPVSDAQPTLRIRELTIGGTAA